MKVAREICPTTTLAKVKEGALLVDVRELNEIKELSFDVSNILYIPLSELENRFSEVPKDKEIVMVSYSGIRSLKTTYYLMNKGYENVFNMKEGIVKWASKGFPTIGSTNSLSETSGGSCCGSERESNANSIHVSEPHVLNNSCS